jgi:hypothetical protein
MIANQTGEPQTSIEETLNAWRTRRRVSPPFVEALADVMVIADVRREDTSQMSFVQHDGGGRSCTNG